MEASMAVGSVARMVGVRVLADSELNPARDVLDNVDDLAISLKSCRPSLLNDSARQRVHYY